MTESRPSYRALLNAVSHVADALGKQRLPASGAVVLVPFAQLLPLVRTAWARTGCAGFAPRFETTHSWAARLAPFAPQGLDFAFDAARDLIVAQQLMHTARLGSAVAPAALVAVATELARQASAVAPGERAAWLAASRAILPLAPDAPHAVESALARLALEWVAPSRYASDALWHAMDSGRVDHVFVLRGLQDDPLVQAWCQRWPERCTVIDLMAAAPVAAADAGHGADIAAYVARRATTAWHAGLALHEASDAEDEAQRAAACVLRHVAAGRVPVALASTDRVVSRRVQALLSERGVPVRDETGWRLSTTRAAATVMRCIELWAPDPATDAVIDALQQLATLSSVRVKEPEVQALEALARRLGAARWRTLAQRVLAADPPSDAAAGVRVPGALQTQIPLKTAVQTLVQWVEDGRASAQGRRPLGQWLELLRSLLQDAGVWTVLVADAAGEQVASALGLMLTQGGAPLADLDGVNAASRPQGWAACVAWVRAVLEAASFRPAAPVGGTDVVLLPLAQFVGRDFAAAVLPGCDEANLPQTPVPDGPFTRRQREALGLATTAQLQQAQARVWCDALSTDVVDVLWRRKDALGNPVSPSGLVEQLRLAATAAGALPPRALHAHAAQATQAAQAAPDPRDLRVLQPALRDGAAAVAPSHLPAALSASAYADLRACPYRFFGLRMLGLREDDEIDTQVNPRDFGSWVHRVLHDFHERMARNDLLRGEAATLEQQRDWMDAAAHRARAELALSEAEFLPFSAAWPDLRDAYLAWWCDQQAYGARYLQGEVDLERTLPRTDAVVVLKGRVDRIDRIGSTTRVIDYKTEHDSRTRQRVKDPYEDTQMAFYAALMSAHVSAHVSADVDPASAGEEGDTLQGGYLQLGERSEPRWFAQESLLAARDALLSGITRDLDAIAAGTPLRALGSGDACAYCAARGLCRKEHWQ